MNDLGPELSAAARRVIAEARGGDDPSAEDEARVKARWLAGIAAGAGVSSLSEAVRAAASTGWGLKAGAIAAAVAAATVGAFLGWSQLAGNAGSNPPASSAPAAPPPAASSAPAAPPPAAEPVPAAAPAPEAPAQPVAELQPPAPAQASPIVDAPVKQPPSPAAAGGAEPVAAAVPVPPAAEPSPARPQNARSATPRRAPAERAPLEHAAKAPEKAPVAAREPAVAAAPAVNGQLGEEIALLSEIRNNLQSGSGARALEQLAEYRRRFGQPNLAMEADALQVDALCRAGQPEAARAAATAFSSNWPNSPLQQRVSAACP